MTTTTNPEEEFNEAEEVELTAEEMAEHTAAINAILGITE